MNVLPISIYGQAVSKMERSRVMKLRVLAFGKDFMIGFSR